MKRYIFISLATILISAICFGASHFGLERPYPLLNRISLGREEFNIDRFKKGDIGERAKMAASLIRTKKNWIGKPIKEIEENLDT